MDIKPLDDRLALVKKIMLSPEYGAWCENYDVTVSLRQRGDIVIEVLATSPENANSAYDRMVEDGTLRSMKENLNARHALEKGECTLWLYVQP